MSEYVLRIENEPQAEALLTYLRSLDFVELLPRTTKQEAMATMKTLLANLPNQSGCTQEEVNRHLEEIRAGQYD